MQVVLSQRMRRPFTSSPLSLYRALRSLNPSPYMFYYDFGDFHVVGASPEILVRKEGSTVTLRPIAGTRPRGATSEADERLAAELLADPKEIAEHVMLVDLGRNDVGRVAQTGTVKLTDRMVVERYSHVMHIVSNVEGVLQPGLTSIDVLRAAFPAGTVSGAPKVRAMEIIDELEPTGRGVYAGAVGYISFQDDMDTAIAIRTARGQGRHAVRAGGRRHRPRFGAGVGVDRNAEQGARRAARRRHGAAGAGRGGLTVAAADRQLRQLHLQPRPVLRRAGRGRARPSQRRAHARADRRVGAGADRHLARPVHAERSRDLGAADPALCRHRSRSSASASATRRSARPSAGRSCARST